MCLKKKGREFFQKLLENFIVKNSNFTPCQVVDHFVWEGIAWQKVYNALHRRKNGQSILCDTHEGKIEAEMDNRVDYIIDYVIVILIG